MSWRTGTKLRRTLYRDEVCVGMVDTPAIATEIVEAMNRATSTVTDAETERHANLLEHAGVVRPSATECINAGEYMRALQQRVAELEQTARDYATLRENHTELQRVARELEESKKQRAEWQNAQKGPCRHCGKQSSIFTAGCDHCDYEDK